MKDAKSRVQSSSMNKIYCRRDFPKESTYATLINIFGEIQTHKRIKTRRCMNSSNPTPYRYVSRKSLSCSYI